MVTWIYAGIIMLASTGQQVGPTLSSTVSFESKEACDAAVMEFYDADWAVGSLYVPASNVHFIEFMDNGVKYVYALGCHEKGK